MTNLAAAIAAARAGRREEARALLIQEIEADETNVQAWLWLSGVVDDPEDIRVCLENVLQLEPGNQQARKGLDWLEARYGPRVVPQPEPEPEPATPSEPEPPSEASLPEAVQEHPPAQAPTVVAAAPAPPARAAVETVPCPFCGQPTLLTQDRCPHCRKSLLTSAAPDPKKGGTAMTILALLWILPGIIALVAVLAIFLGGSVLGLRSGPMGAVGAVMSIPVMVITLVILFIVFLPIILIARGLYNRRRWAYIVAAVLTLVSLCLNIINVGDVVELVRNPTQFFDDPTIPPELQQAFVYGALGSAIGSVVWTLLQILLLYFGYPAVFGSSQRFVYEVTPADAGTHYNNGVALQQRGMWYAAAQEWEAASVRAPADPQYLHALGLAYAQTKQLDKARAALDRAIQLAPGNHQYQESRVLVDRLAGS